MYTHAYTHTQTHTAYIFSSIKPHQIVAPVVGLGFLAPIVRGTHTHTHANAATHPTAAVRGHACRNMCVCALFTRKYKCVYIHIYVCVRMRRIMYTARLTVHRRTCAREMRRARELTHPHTRTRTRKHTKG